MLRLNQDARTPNSRSESGKFGGSTQNVSEFQRGESPRDIWVALLFWSYLSNAASFVLCVVHSIKDRHNLLYYSTCLKKTCIWQGVSGKVSPLRQGGRPRTSRPGYMYVYIYIYICIHMCIIYIYIYTYIHTYIHTYIYIYISGPLIVRIPSTWVGPWRHSQFASEDLHLSGPNPWKILAHTVCNLESLTALPIKNRVPGPPNPWKEYYAGNDCDPNEIGCFKFVNIRNTCQTELIHCKLNL